MLDNVILNLLIQFSAKYTIKTYNIRAVELEYEFGIIISWSVIWLLMMSLSECFTIKNWKSKTENNETNIKSLN